MLMESSVLRERDLGKTVVCLSIPCKSKILFFSSTIYTAHDSVQCLGIAVCIIFIFFEFIEYKQTKRNKSVIVIMKIKINVCLGYKTCLNVTVYVVKGKTDSL